MRPKLADRVQPEGLHNVEFVGRRGHFRTGFLRQQQRRTEQRKFQHGHVCRQRRLMETVRGAKERERENY